MPRLSFTLRDVFWLTLVVAMGVGWWMRERQHSEVVDDLHHELRVFRLGLESLRTLQSEPVGQP